MKYSWIVLGSALLAACSATPTTSPPRNDSGGVFGILVTHEDVELGEITTDVLLNGFRVGEVDIDDVERTRTGLHFRIGPSEAGVYVGVLGEEFADVYDLFGLTAGAEGQFPLSGGGDTGDLFLDYDFGLSVLGGDGDVPIYDLNTGAVIGMADQDLAYVGLHTRAGIGMDFHGIQPMAGFLVDLMGGRYDSNPGGDGDVQAANAGVFAGVGFAFEGVKGRVEYRAGDIEGFALAFGVRF